MTRREWEKIEARFRVWAFHLYYRKPFASEPDLTVRFLKALEASARPIRDKEAVLAWHRARHGGTEADDEDEA